MAFRLPLVGAVLLGMLSPSIAPASVSDVPHPFILWMKDEAVAIRERVENEPWAKSAYEKLCATSDRERGGGRPESHVVAWEVYPPWRGHYAQGQDDLCNRLCGAPKRGWNTGASRGYRAVSRDSFRA